MEDVTRSEQRPGGSGIPEMQIQINDDNKKKIKNREKRETGKVETEIAGDTQPDKSSENKKCFQGKIDHRKSTKRNDKHTNVKLVKNSLIKKLRTKPQSSEAKATMSESTRSRKRHLGMNSDHGQLSDKE